jgi:hypothetical protein
MEAGARSRGERGVEQFLEGIGIRHLLGSDTDRVIERRRAVALARHVRESEGLSIVQIAERLGRSPATIKAYFYDPSDDNKRPRCS